MNTKTLIVTAVSAILLSACNNASTKIQSSSSSSAQSSVTVATDVSWTRIDKETFWNNDAFFTNGSYPFADIAFEYPSKWKFSCCGDMDHGSEHRICSNDSYNETSRWCEKAKIAILEWGLAGCPSGKNDCAIDARVSKTPQEKFDEQVLLMNGDPSVTILPKIDLPALGLTGFVFEKDGVRHVLINPGDSVLDVSFALNEGIDDMFIQDFLSRIVRDKQ